MRMIDADVLKAAFETDGYLSPYMQRMIDACPTVGGWISVKDRLPEPHEDGSVDAVLVTEGFLIHMAFFNQGTWYFCESGEMAVKMFYEVTHWLPLPRMTKEA